MLGHWYIPLFAQGAGPGPAPAPAPAPNYYGRGRKRRRIQDLSAQQVRDEWDSLAELQRLQAERKAEKQALDALDLAPPPSGELPPAPKPLAPAIERPAHAPQSPPPVSLSLAVAALPRIEAPPAVASTPPDYSEDELVLHLMLLMAEHA
jgi:hypothetical protein